jgi:glycosyltransferase involved in cell wall biosynthesis
MKIKAFILTYNESDIIRFTLNHYMKICSDIFVYDNHSTDDTVKICKSMGIKVTPFGSDFFDDRYNVHIKNNAWKEHRDADLIMCIDADEIIYGNFTTHADIFKCVGYNMYSEDMPVGSWDEIECGIISDDYSKPAVFNPNTVKEMNYGFGCHGAKPIINGSYIINNKALSLCHMRYIGGVDRMIRRYEMYKGRMSDFNINNKFGYQYFNDIEKIKQDWNYVKENSKIITR